MAGLADREQVHLETRAEWRAWLREHAATSTGVWLISWKAATGRPRITYDEAVEEALCVGWVDSRPGSVDGERSRLWFAPRSPDSAWSRVNKERVERLLAAGMMLPAGIAVVDAAKASGAWTRLLGPVALCGRIGSDGVVRCDLSIPGERVAGPPRASSTPPDER